MNQSIIRYILFLLAYVPIYIITALKTTNTSLVNKDNIPLTFCEIASNNQIPIFLFTFSFLLIIYFFIYSRIALKPKGNPKFTIKEIKQQHKEYVTYLGTYILPFIALETKTTMDIIAVTFMFLTIGFIFSKTNLIYTNPTLAFFGYEIYEIETDKGKKYDCISKDIFSIGEKPKGIKLGINTFMISKWTK
ncbi:MAG: anti-phage protein KwaA [Lishizhenia sp.]